MLNRFIFDWVVPALKLLGIGVLVAVVIYGLLVLATALVDLVNSCLA